MRVSDRFSRRQLLPLLVPLGGAFLAACSGAKTPAGSSQWVAWPAKDQWPPHFRQAAPEVQEAYRYAVANPQVLQWFPCYCGCGAQGHTSNKDCYIREVRADGSVVLDPMSFG